MTRQTILRLHRGLLGGLAIAAIALLATFYAVVAGAVDLAATKRSQASVPTLRAATADVVKRAVPGRRPVLLAVAAP